MINQSRDRRIRELTSPSLLAPVYPHPMLHSLITRSRALHGRLPFSRLTWSRWNIPSSHNPIQLRKQLAALGIGASIAFVIYHESSLTYNDSDESDRMSIKFSKHSGSNLTSAFEQDMNRQDLLVPNWTGTGIYRVDVAALASSVIRRFFR